MNKSLGKAVLLALAFLAVCVSPAFAVTTFTTVAGNTTTAPVNRFEVNFTQINATYNVTQVNFTLSTGLLLASTTNATNSSFAGFVSGQTIYFGNNTTNSSGKSSTFALNISSVSSGLFNITVTEVNNATGIVTTNLTLNVTNGTIRMNISLVNYTYDGSSLLMNFTGNKSMLTPTGGGTIIDNITFKMYRNGTDMSLTNYTNMTTNGTGVISYTNDATAGIYLFIFNTSGDANYSENSTSVTLKISQATPIVDIFINNTDSNSTVVYPAPVEIRGNATLGNVTYVASPDFNVYVINFTNSSPAVALSANGNPAVITNVLGNASYQIIYNTTGNQNYTTASNSSLFLNVTKGILSISISGTNSTYPTSPAATGTRGSNTGDSDVNYTLWRNNTLASSANGTSPAADVLLQANTTFVYKFNSTGGANWTVNVTGLTMSINVSKGTLNLSLSIPNVTYFSNTVATVTESNIGDADVNYTLYFLNTSSAGMVSNSSALGNGSMSYVKLLGANESNAYFFILNTSNTSGLANWTANASGLTVQTVVSKGATNLTVSLSASSVTNPTQTIATGSGCPAQGAIDVNCILWRNSVLVNASNATNTSETATINTGTWIYNYSTDGGSNWTSNSTTATLTVSAASSTPSSGGGGGPTTPTTRVTVTRGNANITVPAIAASKMANVTIAKTEDVDFRQINISVVNSVNNIKIVITKLAGEPASVTHTIEGKVYHYIEVDNTNFTDSDVSKVFIKFAVNKTWLSDNGVDKTNVSLYRWTNDKWNELSTTYLSEDSYEDFYQTESPGLSYFLIGTSGGEVIVPQAPAPCVENWQCTAWSVCSNSQQARTCTDANACGTTASKPSESQGCISEAVAAPSYAWMYYTVAAIIIIAIAGVLFIFRKKIIKK